MSIVEWGNDQVLLWLRNRNQPENVLRSFREHNITGLTLPMLNSQDLKDMGIPTLRDRLTILENIRELVFEKNALGEVSFDHPLLSELQTTVISSALMKSVAKSIVDETSQKLVETADPSRKEYHTLSVKINKLREEILPILKEMQDHKPLPPPIQTSSSTLEQPVHTISRPPSRPISGPTSGPSSRPTSGTASRTVSRATSQNDILQSHQHNRVASPTLNKTPSSPSRRPSLHTTKSKRTSVHEENDTLKQLRAKTEDPCYKILQAAMKSHRLDRSEWRKYVLVICYGGDKERVLRYDEKPVLVFKDLSELGLSPSIMLRQVEDSDDTGNINYEDYETPGGRL
ncbi:unnamed protein product [Pichia kudriavzevii]